MNRHWLRYGVVVAAGTLLLLAQDQKTPPWAYALNPPAAPGAPGVAGGFSAYAQGGVF